MPARTRYTPAARDHFDRLIQAGIGPGPAAQATSAAHGIPIPSGTATCWAHELRRGGRGRSSVPAVRPAVQPDAQKPPIWNVTGVAASESPDEDEVYRRALHEFKTTSEIMTRRDAQRLEFDRGPICLVFAGDQHLGSAGTDYRRCFEEAELVRDTPGMFLVTMGDVLDQFVVGKLRQARDNARLAICDEWALTRRYLRIVAPKLIMSVGGNHDYWAALLTGVDYFRDVLAALSPQTIYDADDCRVMLRVGQTEFPGRIRHQWIGSSIYNPTHGIERASKWDQDFIWGVGAHTHVSGVVRSFNVGGTNGMAAQVGSYKRFDAFARRLGFARPNTSTAVAIVFDGRTGSMTGFDNLDFVAGFMRRLYA